MASPELSFVIPVYNGSRTIGRVVEKIQRIYGDTAFEVVLVNDGSSDDSEQVCARLAAENPTVTFVHLARNFGEHAAVLAGLHQTKGRYVAVLDDDGQNPPEEVRRLHRAIVAEGKDVVYGRYRVKKHGWFRNLGSRFNDRVANVMLGKPRGLYLSSFKIMNRFVVEEITRYHGAFPYVDGLILRTTQSLGQVEVEHRDRVPVYFSVACGQVQGAIAFFPKKNGGVAGTRIFLDEKMAPPDGHAGELSEFHWHMANETNRKTIRLKDRSWLDRRIWQSGVPYRIRLARIGREIHLWMAPLSSWKDRGPFVSKAFPLDAWRKGKASDYKRAVHVFYTDRRARELNNAAEFPRGSPRFRFFDRVRFTLRDVAVAGYLPPQDGKQ